MSLFTDLPANTYQLASTEVDTFVDTIRDDYGLSRPAAVVSRYLLKSMFKEYGGYDELAAVDPDATLSYHNGSHAAYVMGATVWLLDRAGASKFEKDLGALCAAGHDIRHRSEIPGEDERQTAEVVGELLRSFKLPQLARKVAAPILGTIVEKIDAKGITQQACHAKDILTQSLADADLSAFAAPNAGEWALRLHREESMLEGRVVNQADASAFLERTVLLQRNHRYNSVLARRHIQPIAKLRARQLEQRIPELVADLAI